MAAAWQGSIVVRCLEKQWNRRWKASMDVTSDNRKSLFFPFACSDVSLSTKDIKTRVSFWCFQAEVYIKGKHSTSGCRLLWARRQPYWLRCDLNSDSVSDKSSNILLSEHHQPSSCFFSGDSDESEKYRHMGGSEVALCFTRKQRK